MEDRFWTNTELSERLVIAYERIALALEGLRDEAKCAGAKFWPAQKEQREAIVTMVETAEERAKKMQGARLRTIDEVIDPDAEEEEEYLGVRTRQWLKEHPDEKTNA